MVNNYLKAIAIRLNEGKLTTEDLKDFILDGFLDVEEYHKVIQLSGKLKECELI